MMKHSVLVLMLVLCLPAAGVAGEEGAGAGGNVDAATSVKSGKSNSDNRGSVAINPGTSVKGSKSNTSERQAEDGGEAGRHVKSGKSNTSD